MFRQRAAEVACFAFIAAVGVQCTYVATCTFTRLPQCAGYDHMYVPSLRFFLAVVASQTVTCYTSSTACTSTSVTLTGTRPAGQCCLNRGGRSYINSTSTACTPCVGKFWIYFVLSLCLSPRLCYSIRVL